MSVTVLPVIPPVYDRDVSWPYPILDQDFANAGEMKQGGMYSTQVLPRTDANINPRQIFLYGQGGTGVSEAATIRKGVWCLENSTTSAPSVNGINGFQAMPIIDIAGLEPGFENPSFQRVSWFQFALSIEAASTLGQGSGVLMTNFGATQAADTWPTVGTTTGSFGVVGDGAGSYQWGIWSGGAFPGNTVELVSLVPFIPDPTGWTVFDYVIVSGAPGREAFVELRVGGVAVLNRSWVTAPTLEPSGPFYYQPVHRVGDGAGDSLFLGPMRYRQGAFLPNGTELTS